jgi:hypothetical protein
MIEISVYYVLGFFVTLSAIFFYPMKKAEYNTGLEVISTTIVIFSIIFTMICLAYILLNNVRFVL